MGNTWMVIVGIAIGVAALAGTVVYGTSNPQNYVQDDAVLAPADEQGTFTSESGNGIFRQRKMT